MTHGVLQVEHHPGRTIELKFPRLALPGRRSNRCRCRANDRRETKIPLPRQRSPPGHERGVRRRHACALLVMSPKPQPAGLDPKRANHRLDIDMCHRKGDGQVDTTSEQFSLGDVQNIRGVAEALNARAAIAGRAVAKAVGPNRRCRRLPRQSRTCRAWQAQARNRVVGPDVNAGALAQLKWPR